MEPQVIGRYEIKASLGRGGMATVYHANDPSFARDVAIKVLPHEFLHDPTFRARFEREAQTIAKLEHSAIVPVYDFGEHEGQPYLVMRYMAGGSLNDRIKLGPMPFGEAAAIIQRIGTALDSAHRRDVIHRDVKPANILFDQEGDAYLSDFGIVKVAEVTAQLTGTSIVGTPSYMAPEMVEAGNVSPLIDVYALGVTLFQMLTGKLPYETDTPFGVLLAHANKPIPDAREFRPDLPDEVQAVIEQAMAKDPAERYQTAGDLAAGLAAAVSGAPEGEVPLLPTEVIPVVPDAGWQTVKQERTTEAAAPTDVVEPHVAVPAQPEKRKGLPVWAWILGGVLAVVCCAGIGIVTLASIGGEEAPTETPVPTDTPVPTVTPLPTATEEVVTETTTLLLDNRSDVTICYLYVAPSKSGEWGPDQFGEGVTISSDETFTLSNIPLGTYDMKIEDCSNEIIDLRYNVSLDASGYTWTVTSTQATLTVINNSSYDLCFLYISTSSTDWGPDQLHPDQIIGPGERVGFTVPSGTWNLRGETCDREIYWEQMGVEIQVSYEWTLID